MNKYLVVILIAIGFTSCSEKNEHYYQLHPKELQNALKTCPNQGPQGVTCQQLDQLGKRMNSLAYELQSNPQAFGNKILTLQQTITNQGLELKKNNNQELKISLAQNQRDLADCMSVVKWLESPES
jgi:hypothetical protein